MATLGQDECERSVGGLTTLEAIMPSRYFITVQCFGPPNRYNACDELWRETAYREASGPKPAAIAAGMPKTVQNGNRRYGRINPQFLYYETPQADGTRKVWSAQRRET
jgi:hypothetical protein